MRWFVMAALVLFVPCDHGAELSATNHFVSKVFPLLESRCISCHGPEKQKGGLRLDSRPAILKGGEHGPALVPGDPAKSILLQAVMHASPELGMPPKEKLSKLDVTAFEQWIKEGAVWVVQTKSAPQIATTGELVGDAWTDSRNPIRRLFGGQRLDLWSLRPIPHPPLPIVAGRYRRNPIDRFVEHKLASAKLSLSPEAERRTLIRRLSYDLTGLPPDPEMVRNFLADQRPEAFERLVETFLASPRYGEHWARQWMDVIRYSDSNGFDWDEFRPRAWIFREYLIRSFNADKPFDQLVREQLAGDELFDGPPQTVAEQDALVATGYLRLGPHDNSAGAFNEQDRSRAELLADLTETTSSAFLGLTLSCCRCHDHKYDPISQADHYRFRAFFEGVQFADDLPLDLRDKQAAVRATNAALDEKAKPLQQRIEEQLEAARSVIREERRAKLTHEEKSLLQSTNVAPDLKGNVEGVRKKIQPSDKEVRASLDEKAKGSIQELEKELQRIKARKLPLQYGLLMTEDREKLGPTKILYQGNHKDPREVVLPGFPSILDPNPAVIAAPRNHRTSGRRLTLANWIVSPQNPLTARVLVNRSWQNFFGSGLVATPNDFGFAGAHPSHPELLDWLASDLIDHGWSMKHLHRRIVTSAAYRQRSAGGSRLDASNQMLSHQSQRRLSAEALRDSILFAAGSLRLVLGSAPVWPELPADILKANPAFLDDNAEKTKGWYPSPPAMRAVRSVYFIQKRTVRVPFMETFDLPENSVSCPRRTSSIVAPQALALLNGDETVQSAKMLSTRIEHDAGCNDRKAQVTELFWRTLQRSPRADELNRCVTFLEKRTLPELCRVALNLNEFVFID